MGSEDSPSLSSDSKVNDSRNSPQEETNDLQIEFEKLDKQRDSIREKLKNLLELLKNQGIGLTETLLDDEGYPRNDLDIPSIAELRNKIIYLRNDFCDLDMKLYNLLPLIFNRPQISDEEKLLKPFLVVTQVTRGSPAEKSGLLFGDRVIKIDHLTSENFISIEEVNRYIASNQSESGIQLIVRRGQFSFIDVRLYPFNDSNESFHGCSFSLVD